MSKRFLLLLLLPALLLAGCGKDPGAPEPEPEGAPIEIMVIFAPGQLGDRGYADGIMESINTLLATGDNSLDIRFMTPYDLELGLESIKSWVATPSRPFSSGEYDRRLLVLTEPFMAGYIGIVADRLRPTDEVLLLKMEEEDIAQIAEQFSLGNRVHGLNISARESVKKFCDFMKLGDMASLYYSFPVLRLYPNDSYPYRDGVEETIAEELGPETVMLVNLSDSEGWGIYSAGATQTVVEAAYDWASFLALMAEQSGCPYAIVDLGSGNSGWDYYLMGKEAGVTLWTLMMDVKNSHGAFRFYVYRHFGPAFESWVNDWMGKGTGEMDAQTSYTDSRWYEDNIILD